MKGWLVALTLLSVPRLPRDVAAAGECRTVIPAAQLRAPKIRASSGALLVWWLFYMAGLVMTGLS